MFNKDNKIKGNFVVLYLHDYLSWSIASILSFFKWKMREGERDNERERVLTFD